MSVFRGRQLAKLRQALELDNLSGASGIIASDLVITGNAADTTEQTLASIIVKASEFTNGLKIKAWGTFASDTNTKTIKLKIDSTIVVTNDVTPRPNNLTWEFEATVYKTSDMFEIIGGGIVGAILQSRMTDQIGEADVTITITSQVGTAVANIVICRGLTAESI